MIESVFVVVHALECGAARLPAPHAIRTRSATTCTTRIVASTLLALAFIMRAAYSTCLWLALALPALLTRAAVVCALVFAAAAHRSSSPHHHTATHNRPHNY